MTKAGCQLGHHIYTLPIVQVADTQYTLEVGAIDAESIDVDGGDFGAGVIRGFSVATAGPAAGHGFDLDSDTLSAIIALGNAAQDGVLVHHTHEHIYQDALPLRLGRARNFGLAGDDPLQARADLHFHKSARMGADDVPLKMMTLAEEDPSSFGSSVVITGKLEETTDDESAPPVFRPSGLDAVDLVGTPAANRALFSAKKELPTMSANIDTAPEGANENQDAPQEVAMSDKDQAQLADMQSRLSAIEADLTASRAEAADAKAQLADNERARKLSDASRDFDKALNEGTVYPSERELWLGEYDEADDGSRTPVMLDDSDTPKNLGAAVVDPAFFRRYLATQTRKHSHPVSGGGGVSVKASAIQEFEGLRDAKASELKAANPKISAQDAMLQASQHVAQNNKELWTRKRAEDRQIRGR